MTRRRGRTDFHGLDQAICDGETVAHAFITENGPVQVADDLMHIDQDSPGTLGMEGNRLDVRVNLGPLLGPVSADFMMTANEAPLERPRPRNVRGHGGEGGVEVPRELNAAYAARSSSTSGESGSGMKNSKVFRVRCASLTCGVRSARCEEKRDGRSTRLF